MVNIMTFPPSYNGQFGTVHKYFSFNCQTLNFLEHPNFYHLSAGLPRLEVCTIIIGSSQLDGQPNGQESHITSSFPVAKVQAITSTAHKLCLRFCIVEHLLLMLADQDRKIIFITDNQLEIMGVPAENVRGSLSISQDTF